MCGFVTGEGDWKDTAKERCLILIDWYDSVDGSGEGIWLGQ